MSSEPNICFGKLEVTHLKLSKVNALRKRFFQVKPKHVVYFSLVELAAGIALENTTLIAAGVAMVVGALFLIAREKPTRKDIQENVND
ncbi:hypothetical protein HRE53_30575 (plasmid) [Acaryochloris sp. 'Moss Beach']|uniref:hypothetical protein n=1 Tax=Acaryochloris sp. 'Moss Beach' TaxID=2740837 RepID=UPI001F172E21|nr:hypothetical protein [Acaryochloris sp. 'Moss Beach']UJB72936.1 hypothetical protein HRE53_30575 [Acaryochloris sp. 'Moss Beach']